ncbi:protein of unknown function [Pararobbsia alpina]
MGMSFRSFSCLFRIGEHRQYLAADPWFCSIDSLARLSDAGIVRQILGASFVGVLKSESGMTYRGGIFLWSLARLCHQET